MNNCFSANRYARSLLSNLVPFSCVRVTTPNPDAGTSRRIVRLVLELHQRFVTRRARGQPAPPQQATMPNPCRGAPANPFC